MKVFGILISLIILGASNVFAIIDIQGGVWLLSTLGGTNVAVAETLALIENDAKNGNFKEQFYTTNSFNNYYWYYKINSKEDVSEEDIFQAKYRD